ncbi:hypothetical protein ACFW81_23980 [Streptomyces angustmyceticus]|uniref:hypothetical protein n=1 Tax=Streptomyces angustmyceticus TaxID=285578 RepID=UPI00369CC7E9
MFELRLIDPYGHTVPGTINTHVPAANAAEVEKRLLDVTAPKHAGRWDGINGYRFHAADYRVQKTPEPAVDARGTFLDLLAAPRAFPTAA